MNGWKSEQRRGTDGAGRRNVLVSHKLAPPIPQRLAALVLRDDAAGETSTGVGRNKRIFQNQVPRPNGLPQSLRA